MTTLQSNDGIELLIWCKDGREVVWRLKNPSLGDKLEG